MSYPHFFQFPNGYILTLGGSALVALILLCLFIWRRRILAITAALSLVLFISIAIMIPISWNSNYDFSVSFGLSAPQPNGHIYGSGIHLSFNRGTVALQIEGNSQPAAGLSTAEYSAGRYGGTGVVITTPQHNGLVYPKRVFTLTGGLPWLQDRGFQLVGGVWPLSPTHNLYWIYAIVVPNWFVMFILCPIFPIMWLRRYLKKRRERGFPVSAPAAAPAEIPPNPPR